MTRHLIPRLRVFDWHGTALTMNPNGGVELPPGIARSTALSSGHSTLRPEEDEVKGGTLCFQWLGLMIEISIGRVAR